MVNLLVGVMPRSVNQARSAATRCQRPRSPPVVGDPPGVVADPLADRSGGAL